MAWLASLLKKPETPEEEPILDEGVLDDTLPPVVFPDGPVLAVLAPDIGGISSFQLKRFPDSILASRYLDQMPPDARRATHVFWALHDEPILPADAHREAVVLIRANHTSDVVYVASFLDLESAYSFARFEAKRGLDISHLVIYWAAFAGIREELDKVTILPRSAPTTKNSRAAVLDRPSTIQRDAALDRPSTLQREVDEAEGAEEAGHLLRRQPLVEDSAPAIERTADIEFPNVSEVEAEAILQAEAARQAAAEASTLAEAARNAEVESQRRAEVSRRAEAARQAEAARIQTDAAHQAEAARRAEDALRAEAAQEAEVLREAEAARREAAEQQIAASLRAEALAELGISDATAPPASSVEPVVMDAAGTALAPEPVRTEPAISPPGDEEGTEDGEVPPARGTIFTHGQALADDVATVETPEQLRRKGPSDDPADDLPKEAALDDFDIAYEVERLLRSRRFETRDEPFHGFKSPPGRF
ncbi:MAG: hypothetical protein WD904_11265 [Dehalococcoidia bacterium]